MPPSHSLSSPLLPLRRVVHRSTSRLRWEDTSPDVEVEENPLFLAIDSGVKKMRAAILNKTLDVIWVEEIEFDKDLPQFGTLNGSYTFANEITSPSAMRIYGLELLLDKIKSNCPDSTLLSRVRAVSGATQQHAAYYLSLEFPSQLQSLLNPTSTRLSSLFSPEQSFSLPVPSNSQDWSTMSQCRQIHQLLASRFSSSPPTPSSSSSHRGRDFQREGAILMAERTGSKAWAQFTAAQIMKVREAGSSEALSVLDRTSRICLESSFLASLFLGFFAPVDVAEACSTNLFNIEARDWDDNILSIVMGEQVGVNSGATVLRRLLGPVEFDGGKSLGKIAPYFVHHYGFHEDCIITPFSGDNPSTFLSTHLEERDILFCLSVGDTDTCLVNTPHFVPDPAHHVVVHPAMSPTEIAEGKQSYITMIAGKGAGIGRSLIRDLYCSSQWEIFSRFTFLVPHGGTIGLDNKYFSFFFPHGDSGPAQGFIRFICGARVAEFPDRKVNCRLLLESQFMSYRTQLSRLFSKLDDLDSSLSVPSEPTLSTLQTTSSAPEIARPQSSSPIPARVILFGGPTTNPALVGLLSAMLGCDAFVSDETQVVNVLSEKMGDSERRVTTSSAVGAGYKAAWAWSRSQGGVAGFSDFVKEAKSGRGGSVGERTISLVKYPKRTDNSGNLLDPNVFTPAESVGGGLWLVAEPEKHEFEFYGSMIEEYLRLESYASRGLL